MGDFSMQLTPMAMGDEELIKEKKSPKGEDGSSGLANLSEKTI